MELILISNTKLKIMLDEEDMRKYNIGTDSDCSGGTTRRAIRSLLECAKEQIGFITTGEEIFVQREFNYTIWNSWYNVEGDHIFFEP